MEQRRLSPNLKIYSTKQRSHNRHSTPMQRVSFRLNELARLFRARYGHELPDDDAGRDDLKIALNHLACLPHPQAAIARWIAIWTPWLTAKEQNEIVPPILANPQRYKADALAWKLRLTAADRAALAITTIGAVDMGKAARTKKRKEYDRMRKANERRAAGKPTREQFEANSINRAKPWIAEGISRATWYRRRNAETETSPAAP